MTPAAVEGLARAGCVEVWLGRERQPVASSTPWTGRSRSPRSWPPATGCRGEGPGLLLPPVRLPRRVLKDIESTIRLVRDAARRHRRERCHPLPGTRFHSGPRRAGREGPLGRQRRPRHDVPRDLPHRAYRRLHGLLHATSNSATVWCPPPGRCALLAELDELDRGWFELGRMEVQNRHEDPTRIRKPRETVPAPDLSQRWN
jgi:hypothetical protein